MIWALLALILFAACFALGVWLGTRSAKAAAITAIVSIVMSALRILWRLYPQLEYPLFPFDAYVEIRPWWVFAFALAAVGVGAARMSTRRLRIAIGAFGLLLWVAAAQRLFLTVAISNDGLYGVPNRSGVCPQTTDYTCGAAAAATMLHALGVPATEKEMAGLCGTNSFTGTDEFGVARGLRKKLDEGGWTVAVDGADWDSLRNGSLPAAATVRFVPWIDHWVVVLEAAPDRVTIGDPIRGRETIPKADFLKKWRSVLVRAEKKTR
jgi:hypothetical protein